MNSTFNGISDETLAANLAAIEDMPGMEAMVNLITAEQTYRLANAAQIAARAEMVVICRSASETLAKIRHSRDAEVSALEGPFVKNARLTLLKLLVKTFGGTVANAEKIIMVLMDEHQQTNVGGDVEDAAAYVAAHKTSTVYSTQRPDDADKGKPAEKASESDKPAEKVSDDKPAEKASDDKPAEKASK
jgi:hypothetical protein